ncbi:MAG: ribose-phosphate pyrophosphokinase [Proteobacteria bacterium]|nr:ribose-phosphate pyrophosphokinase [Pseudomonadota bacterium]
MQTIVFPLPGNETLAQALRDNLSAELGSLKLHRFPDAESHVRLASAVDGRRAVFVCTLDRPDGKFLPLLFAAATARDLGAAEVGLVAPYLAYMRQDRRFRAGEGITSTYFAKTLDGWIDWLVTIDPHLHRRSALSEIYAVPAAALHAAPAIAAWIRDAVPNPILVGPDSESEQWVAAVAAAAGAPFVVLEKTRHGDRDVQISVPHLARWRARTPVLVDDIISTARTMIETIGHLKTAALPPPVCIGVHAVFADTAYADLKAAGAGQIVTCNTIPHASNAIDLTDLMTSAVRDIGTEARIPSR